MSDVLQPYVLRDIQERDRLWRHPRDKRVANANQAAHDRRLLLRHVLAAQWRPHERYPVQRELRRKRVELIWMGAQWFLMMLLRAREADFLRMRRASGDCVCDTCGKAYYRHPFAREHLSGIDGAPYLHRLCDGSLVKL